MRPLIRFVFSCSLLFAAACGNRPPTPPGGGQDAGPATILPTDGQLPCAAANLVVTHCASCHGVAPAGNATFSLVRRPDFTAMSALDATMSIGQRALVRMKATVAPMPPVGNPSVTPDEIAAFEAWVTAGMPAGTCAAPTVQTVCTSGNSWTRGLDGNPSMYPGYACISCHAGRNFLGQNPSGASQPEESYTFAGTIYPTFHETDACDGVTPTGAVVEIVDSSGAVALTLKPNSVGNFHSSATVSMPYTARVRANGLVREMTTRQTDGDCNTCHTAGGLTGAPGRIVTP